MVQPLKQFLAISAITLVACAGAYAQAPGCSFNGKPRFCQLRLDFGPFHERALGESRPQLPYQADVLISWPDGQQTTVKFTKRGRFTRGDKVIINGSTTGKILYVDGRVGYSIITIESNSGNVFAFEYGI
jgi:hypothetical protein